MISAKFLFKFFHENDIKFFSGVPDSVLKNSRSYLEKKNKSQHITAVNEGSAISSCIGYYLSTGKLSCAYMQNSGLGNAINPIISIANSKVYSIPILLLIGWRGAPGIKDEPQHLAKGAITTKLLKLLNIKFCVLEKKNDFKRLKKLIIFSKKKKSIIACLIKKNRLDSKEKLKKDTLSKSDISREFFIKELIKKINLKTHIISTTGFTSRELHQARSKYNLKKGKDFYMVGGMGHAGMVAFGNSLYTKNKVICLDGDGSILMHMGSLANIGYGAKKNFRHILLNNFSHESVGGQKTFAENLNFEKIVKGVGYKKYFYLNKKKTMKNILKKFLISNGPSFLEVNIKLGSMKQLSRPKNLIKIKNKFMNR